MLVTATSCIGLFWSPLSKGHCLLWFCSDAFFFLHLKKGGLNCKLESLTPLNSQSVWVLAFSVTKGKLSDGVVGSVKTSMGMLTYTFGHHYVLAVNKNSVLR